MGRRETSDTLVLLQFFASTTKTTRKPYPLGGTNLYGLYKRVASGHKKGFTIRRCGGRLHPCVSLLQREGGLVHNLEILSKYRPSQEPAPALVGLKMGGEHFHILIRKWLTVSQRT